MEKEHRISLDNSTYNGINTITCNEEGCRFNNYYRLGIFPAKKDGIEENAIALYKELRKPNAVEIRNCTAPKPPFIKRDRFESGICSQYTPKEK